MMAKRTILFGLTLIIVGVAGYLLTGRKSVTALIPTFVGLPILISGWTGLQPNREKWTSLIAAVLTLVGLGGCVPGLIKLVSLLGRSEIARPAAVYLQSLMAILSMIYLAFYIHYLKTNKSRNDPAS